MSPFNQNKGSLGGSISDKIWDDEAGVFLLFEKMKKYLKSILKSTVAAMNVIVLLLH